MTLMTCPDCGKSYSDTAAACPNCGYNTGPTLETPEDTISWTTSFLLSLLSFLIPLAGFIVGAIYVSKKEKDYKEVGEGCLALAVINIVLTVIILLAIIS